MDLTFYKYSGVDGALHILNGTLKYDTPSGFNDPFDCLPANKSVNLDNSALHTLFFKKYKREPTLNEKMVCANNLSNPSYHKNINEALRILCLTKKPDNLLMWSHYAEQHKGCCFELDFTNYDHNRSDPFNGNNWLPLKVDYETRRPKISPLEKGLAKEAIYTKSIDWKYEEEWRIMRTYRNNPPENNAVVYPRELFLKRVILGCNVSTPNEETIIELVKDINAKLNAKIVVDKARISRDDYKLEFGSVDL